MHTLLDLAFPALTSPTALVAFASLAAASLLVVLLVGSTHRAELALWSVPVRSRVTALRRRARRAESIRLRDPGAPGRSRPRAPGFRSTAA
ncbi:DUF6412 domain-containing protein [Amycolatopsis vancoresmycina]|uniref:Uncharacterized protein n=1 Tax=Amycolatopsis vancoresmycina DSM 44592 TaxID=1292037 RepID=R1HHD6_9PSEU|nr:DUF6412 domain-containing protein [Amycolatopsis vancoresmycina]EOD59836.1 hypothetical protein H480_41275 [Amycolatopsis vancoresmycina DSM 44592]